MGGLRSGALDRVAPDLARRRSIRRAPSSGRSPRAGCGSPRARPPRRRRRAPTRTGARARPRTRRARARGRRRRPSGRRCRGRPGPGPRPPRRSPGSASIVAIAPSTCRPPWLETTIPSIPCSIAASASAGWRIPLSRIGSRVRSRRNARSSQESDGREYVSTKRRTAARASPERRFARREPGIRARLSSQSVPIAESVMRPLGGGACRSVSCSASTKTGSLVYCAIPLPRRNGR